ncbi:hypothetical protein GGR28_001794 [Lewinella aquimaris]|uniref:Uncharacterized protein n=1 Tax=Neolewinella aquimaris TaxID=1835722 RepID=A0A840E0W6_9BACT|nr:hypothetical protein [Neolewinella aquimaris]MBB4079174.1 hypothetical protein [Neolewinella aquimaris]
MQQRTLWLIFIAFAVLSMVAAGLYVVFTPTPDPPADGCSECIIYKAFDAEEHLNAAAFRKSLDSKVEAEVELKVSDQVSTELSSGHTLGVSEGQVTRTYNSILAGNTTTTQHANLYRAVACAFDQLYCRSQVLTAAEKERKREGVLRDYAVEIYALLDQDNPLLAGGSPAESDTEQPTPSEPEPEIPVPAEPSPIDPRTSVTRSSLDTASVVRATEPSLQPDRPTVTRARRPRMAEPTRSPEVILSARRETADRPTLSPMSSSYLPGTQVYDIVLFAPNDASAALVGGLTEQLESEGLTVGSDVFYAEFMTRFRRHIAAGDWSFLPELQLADRVHCLCRVLPGELTAQPNFRGGEVFTTVTGLVTIELVDVRTGQILDKETITATGRGKKVDRVAAEEDWVRAVVGSMAFRGMGFGGCGG